MAIMIITISLPSLIHRLGGENAKKAKMLAREYQEQLEPKSAKLVRLVKQNPSITLAELMHITHCTIAEARTARFNADSF